MIGQRLRRFQSSRFSENIAKSFLVGATFSTHTVDFIKKEQEVCELVCTHIVVTS